MDKAHGAEPLLAVSVIGFRVQDGFHEVAGAIGLDLGEVTGFEVQLLCEGPERRGPLSTAALRAALRFYGFGQHPTAPHAIQQYARAPRTQIVVDGRILC